MANPNPDMNRSSGVPVSHLRQLVEHWRTTDDWRAQEAALDRHPQVAAMEAPGLVVGGGRGSFRKVR